MSNMRYSILKDQDSYKPVQKLVITQSQLKSPDIFLQVCLWIYGCTSTRTYVDNLIKEYLKTLDQKNELILRSLKIAADRCPCGWILTLYKKVSPFHCVEVSEEEFTSITS